MSGKSSLYKEWINIGPADHGPALMFVTVTCLCKAVGPRVSLIYVTNNNKALEHLRWHMGNSATKERKVVTLHSFIAIIGQPPYDLENSVRSYFLQKEQYLFDWRRHNSCKCPTHEGNRQFITARARCTAGLGLAFEISTSIISFLGSKSRLNHSHMLRNTRSHTLYYASFISCPWQEIEYFALIYHKRSI